MQITTEAITNILTKLKNTDKKTNNITQFAEAKSGNGKVYTVNLENFNGLYDGFKIIVIPKIDCVDEPAININNSENFPIMINGGLAKQGDIKADQPIELVRVGNYFFIIKASSCCNKINLYTNNTEPSSKEGLWIKDSSKKVEGISLSIPPLSTISYIKKPSFNYANSIMCILDNFIYFFGGSNGPKAAHKYDISNNSYSILADIPSDFTNGCCTIAGTNIYLFSDNCCFCYSTENNSYKKISNLPTSFMGKCCVYFSNIYLFNYGKNISYKYDIKNDIYTEITKVPFDFSSGNICRYNGIVYIIGGSTGTFYSYNIANDTYQKELETPFTFSKTSICFDSPDLIYFIGCGDSNTSVYIYNIRNKLYFKSDELYYPVYEAQSFSYDNTNYVFGLDENSQNLCFKITHTTIDYDILEDLPYKYGKNTSVEYYGNIYFMGGTRNNTGSGIDPSITFYKYNISSNSYTQLPDLPYQMVDGTTQCYDGNIYLFGGFYSDTSKNAYKYNINSKLFIKLTDIPNNFSFGGSVIKDTNIYLIGVEKTNSDINSIYKYDIINDQYTYLTEFEDNYEPCGACICLYENFIYIFGSSNSNYGYRAYKYNIYDNTLTRLVDIPVSLVFGATCCIDNKILLIGGSNNTNIYMYDPEKDMFFTCHEMDVSFQYGSAIHYKGSIYLLNGSSALMYKLSILYSSKNQLYLYGNNKTYKSKIYNYNYGDINYIYFDKYKYINNNGLYNNISLYTGMNNQWALVNNNTIIKNTIYPNYVKNIRLLCTNVYKPEKEIVPSSMYIENVESTSSNSSKLNLNSIDDDSVNSIQIVSNDYSEKPTDVIILQIIYYGTDTLKCIRTSDVENNTITNCNRVKYKIRKPGIYTFEIVKSDNTVIQKVISINIISTSNIKDFYINNFIELAHNVSSSSDDTSLLNDRKQMIKEHLTDKLVQFLYNDGYVITFVPSSEALNTYLTTYIDANSNVADGIGGICYYNRKRIYLTCNSTKPQTTMHEIGHAIDHYYKENFGGAISDRDDYKQVYNSTDYKSLFSSDTYFLQNTSEYFAQNFAYYFTPMSLNPMEMDGPNNKKYFDNLNKSDWT